MATQAGVDPVGACVGIKGVRIQAIVKELHDEKIDIIQWDQDPIVYISKAISPARVNGVYLNENEGARTATITADTELVCYGLSYWEFRPLVQQNATIAWNLLQNLAKQLRTAQGDQPA